MLKTREEELLLIEKNIDEFLKQFIKKNSHWLETHLGSIKQLKNRFVKDENCYYSSSFNNERTAKSVLHDVLRNHLPEILDFMENKFVDERICLTYEFEQPIGYGFFRSDELAYETKLAKVVLGRTNDSYEIALVSAFPILSRKHAIEI